MKTASRRKVERNAKPASEAAMPARVLLVEDDPVLAMATEDALRDAGVAHVDVCATSEQALEVLRNERPDAAILDVHLSDRDDGWAIAELLGALGDSSPRIVFATGSPQDIPADIAHRGTVLTKPYLPDELLAALRGPVEKGLLARLRGASS